MQTLIRSIATILVVIPVLANAQDEHFIYGKVYMEDGQVYEGPIRWGKEEIYWTDIFNAAKERNKNLKYLSSDEIDELRDRLHDDDWSDWGNRFVGWVERGWESHDNNQFTHQFSCQFGELKTIWPRSSEWVEVEMQNGVKYELEGEGYNDVGAEIKVTDKEIGEMDLRWNSIDRIEFSNTPSKLSQKFGDALYGTVEAYGDKFEGYIQWDKDERLSTDKLDGYSDDGKVALEMGKIKSIERRGGRSVVTLKSGREFILDGTNDVSSGHRGVVVMNKDYASIEIPWGEFDKVTFQDKASLTLATYNDFKKQSELKGTVTTADGKTISGNIVFDLDEEYDFELLQGKEGEFEFAVPFRDVKKIATKGTHRCEVTLKSGRNIILDDAQDVDNKNHGLLVKSSNEVKYIPWHDVGAITFN